VEESDIGIFLNTENRKNTIAVLKGLGYKYVTIDLQGFRSGSLNEVLKGN
jgi:uncharacterized protein